MRAKRGAKGAGAGSKAGTKRSTKKVAMSKADAVHEFGEEMGPILRALINAPPKKTKKKPKDEMDRLVERITEWADEGPTLARIVGTTGLPPMGVAQRTRAELAKDLSEGTWGIHIFRPGESRELELPRLEDVPPPGASLQAMYEFGRKLHATSYWGDDWFSMELEVRLWEQYRRTGRLDAPVDELMTALGRASGIAIESMSLDDRKREFLWACLESVRAQLAARRGISAARDYFGDPWYRQVPRVHRWLLGDTSERFELRGPGHDYWFAAYYLCRAVLGWSDVGRALQRLPDMSGIDGPARVVVDGWGRRLDALGLWAWTHGEAATAGASHGERDLSSYASGDRQGSAQYHLREHGFIGGHDMFHLGPHLFEIEGPLGAQAVSADVTLDSVRQGRRVVLMVDRFEDWPVHLGALSTQLKGAEPPSWAVDIFSRRDGALGQWRRCWECKRWFQGRAEWHKLGHASQGGIP